MEPLRAAQCNMLLRSSTVFLVTVTDYQACMSERFNGRQACGLTGSFLWTAMVLVVVTALIPQTQSFPANGSLEHRRGNGLMQRLGRTFRQ